ncbi:MAG: chorismate-binding protein [Candidatus Omnitrophica bacterium]|nr:chorismate-binding protein [Candidatus Omnitrophota bacterium]
MDASNRHSYLLLTNPSEVHSGANRDLPNLLESMRGSEKWFGFIGYEFGEITEDIVPRPVCEWSLPDYWLGRFRSSEFIQLKPSKSEHAGGAKVEASLTTKEYLGCLGRIREYLRAGDIYQTNLSVRFETTTDEDPLNLFLSIAERSRSGYACYLDTGEFQVLSVSPELFLHVDQGAIVTCPIKGTMGKTGKPEIDREIYQQLLESEKNLAELLMIVDLERNDLGKICEFGSVSVDQFPEILELPHLFHLLATVRGRLRGGVSLSDILSATFPGGSISGARNEGRSKSSVSWSLTGAALTVGRWVFSPAIRRISTSRFAQRS